MLIETIDFFIGAAKAKVALLKSSLARYLILSMMAGAFVGFGVLLIFSIGAPLKSVDAVMLKALMGASFGVALTLVIFAGSELFTGNNMVMTIGSLAKQVTWLDSIKIWVVSYIGNLIGALLLVLAFVYSGLATNATGEFFGAVSAVKMNLPATQLFLRGILCNMLVCLAVWISARTKEDIAKIFLIFWCLFAFVGSGFEHSIANMTVMGVALLAKHPETVTWWGFAYNLVWVSLGNFMGGAVFLGWAYWFASGKKAEKA